MTKTETMAGQVSDLPEFHDRLRASRKEFVSLGTHSVPRRPATTLEGKTMGRSEVRLALLALSASLLATAGCSGGTHTPSIEPPRPDLVSVTGWVRSIEDLVPVDGGVTIEVGLDSGRTETLLLGSFFTPTPPPESQVKLYQVIQEIRVGDRVTAQGRRTDRGIDLESIAVVLE